MTVTKEEGEMMDRHQGITDFLANLAQTNDSPYLIEVDRAEGIYIQDRKGKLASDYLHR